MSDEWVTVKKAKVTGRPKGSAPNPDTSSTTTNIGGSSGPSSSSYSSGSHGPVGSASYGQYKNSKPQQSGRPSTTAPGAMVEQKFNAGHNKQKVSSVPNARKIEEEDEDFHLNRVGHDLALAISQARSAKNMTRNELANIINEKVQVVAEAENPNAVVNHLIVSKIERALGTSVRVGKKKAKKLSHKQ